MIGEPPSEGCLCLHGSAQHRHDCQNRSSMLASSSLPLADVSSLSLPRCINAALRLVSDERVRLLVGQACSEKHVQRKQLCVLTQIQDLLVREAFLIKLTRFHRDLAQPKPKVRSVALLLGLDGSTKQYNSSKSLKFCGGRGILTTAKIFMCFGSLCTFSKRFNSFELGALPPSDRTP